MHQNLLPTVVPRAESVSYTHLDVYKRQVITKDSLKRLHIYADANYEQQAQKPVALDVE